MLKHSRVTVGLSIGGAITLAVLAAILLMGGGDSSVEHREDSTRLGVGEIVDLDAAGPFPLTPGLYVLEVDSGRVWRVLEQEGFDASSGASYQWSQDGEWLVSTSVGNFEKVIAVSRDGRERRETTGQSWSVTRLDDGSFVVHMRPGTFQEEKPEIAGKLDLDSMTVEELGLGPFSVAVAPNGLRAIALEGDGQPDLIDLVSGEQKPLLPRVGETSVHTDFDSIWSPDSRRVVAFRSDFEGTAMLVVDAEGREAPAEIARDAGDASWSPNGRRLAYVAYDYNDEVWPQAHLEVRRSDGSGGTRRLGQGSSPEWSPDAESLAFVREGELWRVHVDSGREERLVPAALPVIEEPRWSPGGRYIAFWARPSGGEIVVIDTDGSNERIIGSGLEPRWSPDGERIAFINGKATFGLTGVVATMKADGSDAVSLGPVMYSDQPPGCQADEITWSPDSSGVAWWSGDAGTLYVAPADGSAAAQTFGEGPGASWSPDSRHLVYAALRSPGNRCHLYTVAAGGGMAALLAELGWRPAWSPDGRWIAYETDPQGPSPTLNLISPDNRAVIRRNVGTGVKARWSPDSTMLAYYQSHETTAFGRTQMLEFSRRGSIVVQPIAEGSAAVAEIEVDGSLGEFAWSPDGQQIVFSVSVEGEQTIYVVEIDEAAGPKPVANGSSPSWAPDGKRLVFERNYRN